MSSRSTSMPKTASYPQEVPSFASIFISILDDPQFHRLALRLSHAQYDAFSAPTLHVDLGRLYAGAHLEARPTFHTYARFANHQARSKRALNFWRTQLAGSKMPRLVPRTPFPTLAGKKDYAPTNAELQTVVSLPGHLQRHHGIGHATCIKAAWALTLVHLTGEPDALFGDLVSGRRVDIPGLETEKIVGPCMNFVPLRVKLPSTAAISDWPSNTKLALLRQVQETQLKVLPFEAVGFRRIREECTQWGAEGRFSSIVNYVSLHGSADDDAADNGGRQSMLWHALEGEDALEVRRGYEERTLDKTDLWVMCMPEPETRPGANGHEADAGKDQGDQEEVEGKKLRVHLRYSDRVYGMEQVEDILNVFRSSFSEVTML